MWLKVLLAVNMVPHIKFFNFPCLQHDSADIWLTLALEWMVAIIVKGFEVMRYEIRSVVNVENYCSV